MADTASLFNLAIIILKRNSLDWLVSGYDHELVNILLTNHLEKVKAADSFQQAQVMMNEALSAHMGFPIDVQSYMAKEQDRKDLYTVFDAWRALLLKNAKQLPERVM